MPFGREKNMADLVFLVVALVFFGASLAYVIACERL